MIGYADGQATILCDELLTEGGHDPVSCDQQAVMMVVSDGYDTAALEAWAWCADHAPEAAHEAASSMTADEYVIVTLTGGAS